MRLVGWAALFLLSGCSGLIFEVLWTRQASLLLGGTVEAAALVAAAFLTGLGLGAHWAGRWAPRLSRPLLVFAGLELAVAGLGVAVTALFPALPGLLGQQPQSITTLVTGLVLLGPTIAMGGTLPVLVHGFTSGRHHFARVLTVFYGLNTVGAALGAYLTDAWLVGSGGVWKSGCLAASLDLFVATVAFSVGGRVVSPLESAPEEGAEGAIQVQPVLVLALSSFIGLVYQLSWTRMLAFVNGSDVGAYSMVLVIYLLGLGLGGLLLSRSQPSRPRRWLGTILLTLGFLGFLGVFTTAAIARLAERLQLPQESALTSLFTSALCLFPASLLLGLTFPLGSQWLHQTTSRPARTVAFAYLFSIAGSVLGALSCGNLWLPFLGLQGALSLASVLAMLTAGWLLASRWSALAVALGLALVLLTPRQHLLQSLSRTPLQDILYHGEDAHGSVYLVRDHASATETQTLMVDGFNMAGDDLAARRYTAMLILAPALSHPAPKDVLVICLGMANTCGTALQLAGIESVECVELSKKVVEALHHSRNGPTVLNHPKLRLTLQDGRHHLLTTDRRYDLITAEPPPPRHSGVVNLYSREYYELCKRALKPGGVAAQWLPVFELSDEDTRAIMRAFQDVFPYCHLWQGDRQQLVLVGSLQPIEYRYADLRSRVLANRQLLQPMGLDHPELVAGSWMAGPRDIAAYTDTTQALTDDHPSIQYLTAGETLAADVAWLFQVRPLPIQVAPDLEPELLRGRLTKLREWAYSYARLESADRWVLGRLLFLGYPNDPYYDLVTLSSPDWRARATLALARARIDFLHDRLDSAAAELRQAGSSWDAQILSALVAQIQGNGQPCEELLRRGDLPAPARDFLERRLGRRPPLYP